MAPSIRRRVTRRRPAVNRFPHHGNQACKLHIEKSITESVLLKAFAALVLARIFCMALLGFEGGV